MSTLDTHTIVKELVTAGIAEKQAEVFVGRFVIKEELDTVEKEHSQLATKADIIKLENTTRADIAKLESKIDKIEAIMKFDRTLLAGIFLMMLTYLIKTSIT